MRNYSEESSEPATAMEFPPPPMTVPTKTSTPSRTPARSPFKKVMRISQTQKQALIDNLQLEITERARKLRAQYALQAQGLRARIEIRVNRIPISLRTANMGELFAKYAEEAKAKEDKGKGGATAIAVGKSIQNDIPARDTSPAITRSPQKVEPFVPGPARTRGLKRQSEDFDKENDPANTLENPKKRTKDAKAGASASTRTVSRAKLNPSLILSPKSNNSRTYPVSPIRPASPAKPPTFARPASPAKGLSHPPKPAAATTTITVTASLSGMAEQAKSTRATTRSGAATTRNAPAASHAPRTRRAATAPRAPAIHEDNGTHHLRTVSSSTASSNDSTGTTVVKKSSTRAQGATAASSRKTAPAKKSTAAAAKRVASKKVEPPAPGRRVLRSRH
ncbi:MAG: hypothetical protein M1834_004956 [Cirrosporium novae-zelandiae]|nr:MAG: hypothetical protein M1834_004956 [Cirrosporium novae-zelandiae]